MSNPNACPDCGHEDIHTTLVGCLAEDCDCQTISYRTPEQRARGTQEGRQRGRQGAETAAASHAMTVSPEGPEWRAKAEARLAELLDSGEEFTADDITEKVGPAPSPSAIGSLFRAESFTSRAQAVGFTTSTRPVAHGRPLRVWKAKA